MKSKEARERRRDAREQRWSNVIIRKCRGAALGVPFGRFVECIFSLIWRRWGRSAEVAATLNIFAFLHS